MRRYGRYNRYCKEGETAGLGCLALILLAIFALPLIGIYRVITGNEEEKATGIGFVIIGIIIWIIMALVSH